MHKKVFRFVYALNYVLQAGFTFICPAGLIILGGWLLHNRCGVGRWVMIVAIVFGVLAGMLSFFKYIIRTVHQIDPTSTKGDPENDGTI